MYGQNKDNQQTPTSANNKPILAYQFFAMQLKYEGHTSERISTEIGKQFNQDVKPSTVRWWFCRLGPLRKFYEEFCEERNEEVVDTITNVMKKNAQAALAKIDLIIESDGHPQQFQAAKFWVEAALELTKNYEDDKKSAQSILEMYVNRKRQQIREGYNYEDEETRIS